MTIWDPVSNTLKSPVSADLVKYIKVAEGLPYCDALSSALYCSDIPVEMVDSYRNYLLLKYATKPYVSGAYSVEGQKIELEMATALRGGKKGLAEKPIVVMTACPSPPLKWSYTAENIMLSAEAMVPMGIGPMPLSGGTGPVTLIGTIVQHTAEALSGLVISQLSKAGAPVLWMNPTSIFDMSEGTTTLGAIETHLMCIGTHEVAKHLGIPSLNYLGVSDSKMADGQQAMETTCGIILAALCRSNLNGSLGMIDFESGQSFEGLVISNEAAGMARRLLKGINDEMDNLGSDLIMEMGQRRKLPGNGAHHGVVPQGILLPGDHRSPNAMRSGVRTVPRTSPEELPKRWNNWLLDTNSPSDRPTCSMRSPASCNGHVPSMDWTSYPTRMSRK